MILIQVHTQPAYAFHLDTLRVKCFFTWHSEGLDANRESPRRKSVHDRKDTITSGKKKKKRENKHSTCNLKIH